MSSLLFTSTRISSSTYIVSNQPSPNGGRVSTGRNHSFKNAFVNLKFTRGGKVPVVLITSPSTDKKPFPFTKGMMFSINPPSSARIDCLIVRAVSPSTQPRLRKKFVSFSVPHRTLQVRVTSFCWGVPLCFLLKSITNALSSSFCAELIGERCVPNRVLHSISLPFAVREKVLTIKRRTIR